MEREGGGTRKGGGDCVRLCVCLMCTDACARVHTYTLSLHSRATHTHIHAHEYTRESSSMCRTSMRRRKRERGGGEEEKDGGGWAESAGMDGFEGGYEGMSGGRACMWALYFVRVSLVGVTARWKLNDACRRRQTSIH